MDCVAINEEKEFTSKQKKLLLCMLTSRNVKEAAKACGMRVATAFKYLKDRRFKNELERLQNEIFQDTINCLKVHSKQAVVVLAELMNKSESDAIRRGAACDILTHTHSFVTTREIQQRLETLEVTIINNNKGTSLVNQTNFKAA